MQIMEKNGIPTHFVEEISDRETVVKRVEIVPLEVIIRNIAAGSFSKRFGVEEGKKLNCTTLEYCLKNDDLGDPMINDYQIIAIGAATKEDLDTIADLTFKVNDVLKAYFESINIELVDFKIEFGKLLTVRLFLRMKSHLTLAVYGTLQLTKNLTKTVSDVIWAMLKRHMQRYLNVLDYN